VTLRHVVAVLALAATACGSEPVHAPSADSSLSVSTSTPAAPSSTSVTSDSVSSVEARTYLGATQYYIDPAPGAVPTFSEAQIRQLGPQLSDQGSVQRIVLGYYHDAANDPPGAKPPLVYLVTIAQPVCVPSSSGVSVSVVATPCNIAVVVDATTGSPVISVVGV
jgi:hypothetical protein